METKQKKQLDLLTAIEQMRVNLCKICTSSN